MAEDERRRYRMLRGAYAYMGSSPSGNKIGRASGNVATFNTDLAAPLISLNLDIEPHQEGTGDPSLDNIRPITGWNGVTVTRLGKNLLNNTAASLTRHGVTFTVNNDGTVTANGTATENVIFSIPNPHANLFLGQRYILTGCPSGGSNSTYRIAIATPYWIYETGNGVTFTEVETPVGELRINIYKGYTCNNLVFNPMIRSASITDATYEPYTAQTYPISFGIAGTVYGGTLDVTTGVLTVTDGYIESYAGESLPSTWISDRDVYASGASPTIGAQVVYKLATPVTYQLTPTEVRTLIGTNNIFMDADGTVQVEYQYRS